jgi:hypothetical protein
MPDRRPTKKKVATQPAPQSVEVKRKGATGKQGSAMAFDILKNTLPAQSHPGVGTMTGRSWQSDPPPPVTLDVGEDDPATPPVRANAPVPSRQRNQKKKS